jgi:hypothetical protein
MTHRATGPFDVTLAPLATAHAGENPSLGRMSIEKEYHGNLAAIGTGEMLTASTDVQGSAGYVAMERVVGTLDGRRGSFVLQHSATMTRGAPRMSITVVPDSGTEELAGLTGTMLVIIADGRHSYDFDYSFASAAEDA